MILLVFLCTVLWVVWGVYRLFAYRYHPFRGKVVLVTGACSEVGRRLCVQLYAEGACVIAWDYSKVRLDEMQREIVGQANTARGTATSTATSSPPSSPGSPAARRSWNRTAPPFFEVAMVDLSSRLQVQRAVKELLTALPGLCANSNARLAAHVAAGASGSVGLHTASASTAAAAGAGSAGSVRRPFSPTPIGNSGSPVLFGVDAIFNAAHVSPSKPLLDRTEDTVEKALTTNTLAPVLLAKLLCPLMLEYKSGGHLVNFTSTLSSTRLDGASPDYAASQWGVVGAHYSLRAWLRQLRATYKLPGEVRTTLVYLDAMQMDLPSLSSFSSAASTWNRSAGGSAAAGAPAAKGAAALSTTSATGPTSREGSLDGKGEAEGKPSEASAAAHARHAASLALDRQVQRALRAVGRGEESYCPSYRVKLAPIAYLLPVPWMSRVLGVLTWRRGRDGASQGNDGKLPE